MENLCGINVYAVGSKEFSIAESVVNLVLVVLHSVGIGFLDAASRGCVVALDCESEFAGIGKLERCLYKPFAERAATDDNRAVVVLQSAGKDFACTGCEFIDEHGHRFAAEGTGSVAVDYPVVG